MTDSVPPSSPRKKEISMGLRLTMMFTFIGATVALALWLVIARIWPATILIDLQADWFDGEYYPKFTVAIVWIIIIVVPMFALSAISWMINKLKGKK